MQSKNLDKDSNQTSSSGIDQSKAQVSRGTQGEIEIQTITFGWIRA